MQNRCGYCYERGHNKRTCPDYTNTLQAQADNGSTYAQRQLDTRGKGRSGSSRTCSFCQSTGHDRRTCERLLEFISKDSRKTMASRQKFLESMKEAGCGPGALVSLTQKNYDYNTDQYVETQFISLVTKIRWEDVTHRTVENGADLVVSSRISDGAHVNQGSPAPINILSEVSGVNDGSLARSYFADRCPKVLSPVSASIYTEPPSSYFDEKTARQLSKLYARDLKTYSHDVAAVLEEIPDE